MFANPNANAKAKPIKKSKIRHEKGKEAFLSYVRKRFDKADPDAKKRFSEMVEGVDFEVSPTEEATESHESYFVDENSREFGLTKGDYEFLLGDIEQAIEDGHRKYGCGEAGYVGEDGNFYPFPDNDKPRRIGKPSPTEVGIERGLIKVYHPEGSG
jgi:hypothetical protein